MTKILCVEDSEDSLFTLHKRLVLAGFEVKVAMNGAEGVDWAKTLLPDLIVMDLRLPGLDASQPTRRLKAQPQTKHIPIHALACAPQRVQVPRRTLATVLQIAESQLELDIRLAHPRPESAEANVQRVTIGADLGDELRFERHPDAHQLRLLSAEHLRESGAVGDVFHGLPAFAH